MGLKWEENDQKWVKITKTGSKKRQKADEKGLKED